MLGAILRFVVSALVLMFVGFLLPGIRVANFTTAVITALVIAFLGWVVEMLLGDRISPRSRGWVGFITAAVVIYVAGMLVGGFQVDIVGALLASFVIGLIDAIVPTELR
ncbi:MAG: phage holin family protein [Firmicutes bacterium]|nr:phage holin family protein [Bacillota bacterium]